MRIGIFTGLLLNGAAAMWESKEKRCDKVIEFLAHEGRLTVENRVFRRMDEFRHKLYREMETSVHNCTMRIEDDEMEGDIEDRNDERMSFENVDNKISMCSEGFRWVINKMLPLEQCGNARSRTMRFVYKLTNQLTYAKERVMKRNVRASMRSRNPDKVRPLTPEMLAERETKRARKTDKHTARVEKTEQKSESAEQRESSKRQKLEKQVKRTDKQESKESKKSAKDDKRTLKADDMAGRMEKKETKSDKRDSRVTNQTEKEQRQQDRGEIEGEKEADRVEKVERKEISQEQKTNKQAQKIEKEMRKSVKKEE